MYIYFMTFGCKVNTYETAALSEAFSAKGHTIAETPEAADMCVINSCSVTAESVQKLKQALRKLRRLCPDGIIAVTGCFPQSAVNPSAELPEADIITGTKDRSRLPELAEQFSENRRRVIYIPEYNGKEGFENMLCSAVPGHTRAFLKIQDGCDNFCSYCIIPYSRGRIRSKSPDILKAEAKELAAAGYSEIVLTGINLAFYGKEYGLSLSDAVNICAAENGIERVRLGSLEPEMLTDRELDRLAALPQFCPSFHLSLQSGCEKTLKAMNRHYTPSEYAELVMKIRDKFPDCSITTDVMTGFPGETEEDFSKSLEFVKKTGFSDMHVFPYSPRNGTRAAAMEGQVPAAEKRRRAALMTDAGKESRRLFLESQVGKTYPVLFEREKNDGYHGGYTPNYTFIKILTENSKKSLRNLVFYVTIDMIDDNRAFGHISERDGCPKNF